MATDPKRMVGRIVKGVYQSCGDMYLTFEDGTFARLSADCSGSFESVLLERESYGLDYDYVEIGVISTAEFSEWSAEQERKLRESDLEHKRKQYLALKAIFEPGGNTNA